MAKSFVVRYRGLKFFVMPYVQLHYLITPLFAVRQGGGEGLSIGKLEGVQRELRLMFIPDQPRMSRAANDGQGAFWEEHLKRSIKRKAPPRLSHLNEDRGDLSRPTIRQISATMS